MSIATNRPSVGRSRGFQGGGAPWIGNGAMIGWLGLLKLRSEGSLRVEDSGVQPYQRTDAVEVTWR